MRYTVPLQAGVPTVVRFRGRNITIMDIGSAAEVDLKLNTSSQQDEEEFGGIGRNFSIFSPDVDLTGATLTSATATTVEFIVTNFRIETIDGTTLTATISPASLPLSVTTTRGTAVGNPYFVTPTRGDEVGNPYFVTPTRGDAVGNPFYVTPTRGDSAPNPLFVSGAVLGDTPAATITDNVAVAVTDAGAALLAAAAARLEFRVTNIGASACAIGFTGITWAKRCIVLQPGDTWSETRGAALAWAAITAAGTAASLTVQEMRS